MAVYDENGAIVENPDLSLGSIGYETRIKEGVEPLGEDKPVWLDSDYETIEVYRPHSKDHLAEMEAGERANLVPQRVDSLESGQADTDDALCELYERGEAQQAEFDDALCAIYEMQLGGAE